MYICEKPNAGAQIQDYILVTYTCEKLVIAIACSYENGQSTTMFWVLGRIHKNAISSHDRNGVEIQNNNF